MSDYSNVNICGRMTEPKFIKVGEKQTLKAVFSIAVNRWRKRGETELNRLAEEQGPSFDKRKELFEKKTVWKRCIAWGKLAEQVQEYGKKGVRISANGDEDIEYYYDKDGIQQESQFVRLRVLSIFNLDKMNGNDGYDALNDE
jgi:single-stranded DNA-binding protein